VFTYAEGGGTLMHATYQVEWTGKSMLKSEFGARCSLYRCRGEKGSDLA